MKDKKEQEEKVVPIEMVKKAQALYKAESQSSEELGKVLKAVREITGHGGWKKWVAANIGRGTSVMNRCNYCRRLVEGKVGKKKTANPAAKERKEYLQEVMKNLAELYKHATEGHPGPALACANVVSARLKELIERAEANEKKASKSAPAEWHEEKPKVRAVVTA